MAGPGGPERIERRVERERLGEERACSIPVLEGRRDHPGMVENTGFPKPCRKRALDLGQCPLRLPAERSAHARGVGRSFARTAVDHRVAGGERSAVRPSKYTRGRDGAAVIGRGRLLTIEGPEGAGKTTQAERLRRAAEDAGIPLVATREPGGTPLGERVRAMLLARAAGHDPRADALLFNAARAQLVADVIGPALERGELVICTRFTDSTLAYQGYGAGLPLAELRAVADVATGGLRPDLTLLLDLPTEVGLARKSDEQTRFETDFPTEFHRRVRDGFLALAAAEPERFVVVDAARPADAVEADLRAAVARLPGLEVLASATSAAHHTRGEPDLASVRIHR